MTPLTPDQLAEKAALSDSLGKAQLDLAKNYGQCVQVQHAGADGKVSEIGQFYALGDSVMVKRTITERAAELVRNHAGDDRSCYRMVVVDREGGML